MTEKASEVNAETFNAADLLDLLDEFMGRRARWGGDTVDVDSGQTIAAVGLFIVNVGWILRLDQHRYIRLPGDETSIGEPIGMALRLTSSNGAQGFRQTRSRHPRGDGKQGETA